MKNLYVGNLPHSTTEAELRNLFAAHGAVEKITLVTDRDTGRSRGFGFVEMINASEADKAVAALNGTDLGGRPLTINEAKPKSEHPRGGSRRFGGGGGRGHDDYRGNPRPRQRDKAERRNQRKQEKAPIGSVDEVAELREHAAEQAALFNIGSEEANAPEKSTPGDGGNK